MPKRKWKNPSGTPEYYAWRSMWLRCKNPKAPGYKNWGGRGIKICERWKSYDNFFADMSPKPFGLTLERKDNNGDYTPNNCRWATIGDQLNNQRRNRLITYDGVTLNIAQWAKRLGLRRDTLSKRLIRMPPADALRAGHLWPKPICGERSGYESGCRCRSCKDAHNARMREQRARRNKLKGDER